MEKVCVVGLGVVGYPTAKYIHQQGFQTFGFDIVEKHVREFKTFTEWDKIPTNIDVFVIAVGTNWINHKPDVSSVFTVSNNIARRHSQALVSVESTVPLGTCRQLSEECGLYRMVHAPHRYWTGDPVRYGVRQRRVIGALNEESLDKALAFYNRLGISMHICPTIEVAELCKIAENAYRYVQIAFAESLALICKNNGISFKELKNATYTKWYIELLEAREGIGGTCLPIAIQYLRLAQKGITPLLDGAISVDELYKNHESQ